MTLPRLLPNFILSLFFSMRAAWVIETNIEPASAFELFASAMRGDGASGVRKVGNKLGARNQKWAVEQASNAVVARCVDGWPARIFTRNKTIRISPAGQVIHFVADGTSGANYRYQLVPDTLHTFWGMLAFSAETRHFYRRVVRALAGQAEVSIRYPLSFIKLTLWAGVVVAVVAANI